jgi:hypothetical protein
LPGFRSRGGGGAGYAFRERPGRFEVIGLALLVITIALVLNGGG